MGWEQLRAGVTLPFDPAIELPALFEVDLPVPSSTPSRTSRPRPPSEVVATLAGAVGPGTTVAVGAGQPRADRRVELLRGRSPACATLGAEPFVVPAMGSHGGATADGQRAMLADLGMTDDCVGAEIRSTMATAVVAPDAGGLPIHLDATPAAPTASCPSTGSSRTPPSTGPIESGCTKMAVVGFGKQPGAAQVHACSPVEMRDRMLDGIAALRATGRLLGGVATLEGPGGDVVAVRGLTADDVGGPAEIALTDESRRSSPPLPFEEIDVLIIERGGKDISGTMLDPNVTGRFWIAGLADLDPRVADHRAARVHRATAGNALGIGFVDFVPAAVAETIDWADDVRQLLHRRRPPGSGGPACRWCCPTRRRASAPPSRRAAGRSPPRGSCAIHRRSTSPVAGSATPCSTSSPAALPIVPPWSAWPTLLHPPPVTAVVRPDRPGQGTVGSRRLPRRAAHGLLVRALEQALPEHRLARITVDLSRPVPMAGFRIKTEVLRAGRAAASHGGDRRRRRRRAGAGVGEHVADHVDRSSPRRLDNSGVTTPRLADADPRAVPDPPHRPRAAVVQPRRGAALPARRGRRTRRHHGVDADRADAAGRGAVTVPAHLPARRLRQRLQPARRGRPDAVHQHRPDDRPPPRPGRRVARESGGVSQWQPSGSGSPTPCSSTTRVPSAGPSRRCCCGRSP